MAREAQEAQEPMRSEVQVGLENNPVCQEQLPTTLEAALEVDGMDQATLEQMALGVELLAQTPGVVVQTQVLVVTVAQASSSFDIKSKE